MLLYENEHLINQNIEYSSSHIVTMGSKGDASVVNSFPTTLLCPKAICSAIGQDIGFFHGSIEV
jgi:hypothetical protein